MQRASAHANAGKYADDMAADDTYNGSTYDSNGGAGDSDADDDPMTVLQIMLMTPDGNAIDVNTIRTTCKCMANARCNIGVPINGHN